MAKASRGKTQIGLDQNKPRVSVFNHSVANQLMIVENMMLEYSTWTVMGISELGV